MDREQQIIDILQGLTDVVTGMQKTIGDLIEVNKLLKGRIEALQRRTGVSDK